MGLRFNLPDETEHVEPAMNIFFYEAFAEEERELRALLPPGWEAGFDHRTLQACAHPAPPAPHISIRTQSVLPVDWLPRLSSLVARSTGYDHLLGVKRLTPDSGPQLACLPKYCGQAVAEHALLLWLALSRKFKRQTAAMPRFARDGMTGIEMEGKTLAVAGVGDIGSRIARIGLALGMQVLGVDPVRRHDGIAYVDLDQAIAAADILVCAMNLTGQNRGLFDTARFSRARPGLLFVNVSRGECSPFTALRDSLDRGYLGGVALDVFNHEAAFAEGLRSGRMPSDPELDAARQLMDRDQVMFTPHNAFNTHEATHRKAALTVDLFRAFDEHGRFPNQPEELIA